MDPKRYDPQAIGWWRAFRLPGGIQARLFLLIALVLLPMAVMLGWTSYQRYLSLREDELQNELEVAQGTATSFATYVSGVREQLFTIGQAILTFSPYSRDKATRLLMTTAAHFPAIRDVSWVGADGTVLASSASEMVGRSLSGLPYYREILAGPSWVISDLFLESGTAVPAFVLATALRDDDGILQGMVMAAIGPKEVGALALTDRPARGAIAIFDRQGTVVYISAKPSLSWEESRRWQESDPLLQQALATGQPQTGIMAPPALEGEWISARVPIAGLGWIAGAGRPTEIAFAPIRKTMGRDVSLTVLISLTAFLLAYFLARTMSEPLRRLEQDAQRMETGEIARENDPRAPAEVRSLRDTVAQMAISLLAAKNAAEEASRAKSEFLANMSHELRTPMTVIMGSLEYLQRANVAPGERQLLDFAYSSAQRLLGIIDDLLDISRIEAGRLKIEEIPFDLRECVRQAVGMFSARGQEKGLHLHWRVQPQIPSRVRGDPDRLGQVLVNLVGNAVKFTDHGEVALVVEARNDELAFLVTDTGSGIPADKIGQLFQPFTQVDSSLTRRHGGTGLGLAISRELVELMGGTIGVESVEGQGSTFSFTLPLRPAARDDASTSPPQADTATARVGHPARVLLAEDDPQVRGVVKMTLEGRGVEVIVAESGRQTVERWKEQPFDLILMDLQMPEMDGLAATREIRSLEKTQDRRTCIFALTAHVREEDRRQCLAAGMDGFLAKPLRLEQLDSLIETCPCRLPQS